MTSSCDDVIFKLTVVSRNMKFSKYGHITPIDWKFEAAIMDKNIGPERKKCRI